MRQLVSRGSRQHQIAASGPAMLRWMLVGALCAAMMSLGVTSNTPARGATDTVRFGARVQELSGESSQAAFERFEGRIGRPLGVAREFLRWDSAFPTSFHTWLKDTGHTLVVSVRSKTKNDTVIPWSSIAGAKPGSTLHGDIVRWGERMRDFGAPIYFTFNHEPESKVNSTMGTAEEFKAAWQKIYTIFRDVVPGGVPNVKFMWIMTDYSFSVGSQSPMDAAKWYPGDAYLEAMGANAYNWHNCRTGISSPWMPLEQIIQPFRDFGALHPDEELWLPEWASTEDPEQPGRKAEWLSQAQALFKRADYAQFKGLAYFNYQDPTTCSWYADSSAASLSAFASMANDEFYGGDVPVPPPPPPPPPPVPIELAFHAVAGSNGQRTTHGVQIPTSVQAGDTLFLFFTYTASKPAAITSGPPPGWTPLRSVDGTGLQGRIWVRTATALDAGATVSLATSALSKADLGVVAYRGTATDPVDVHQFDIRSVSGSKYTAPSVTTTQAGDWVVVYWADKSSYNTGHTIPGSLTRRRTVSGPGGGHITATIADTGAGVPAAKQGPFTATGTAASGAWLAYTIALRPVPPP